MKETYTGLKGIFKIQTYDSKGNLLDEFEEKNLIVDSARLNLAKLIGGFTTGTSINKFVLGTRGHVDNGGSYDILIPKTIVNGLDETRTELFSEEEDMYSYSINFQGIGSSNGNRNVISETDVAVDANTLSTVSLTNNTRSLIYTIVIPSTVANNLSGQGGTIAGTAAFTEAGFYCGTTLFNIKTFPAKVKQLGTTITVTWTLEF
jgi:hypothetical protein